MLSGFSIPPAAAPIPSDLNPRPSGRRVFGGATLGLVLGYQCGPCPTPRAIHPVWMEFPNAVYNIE
jgi:hypothetical protein